MRAAKQTSPDPLYVIFEQHLYNFQDSDIDRTVFIGNVVQDYFAYLRKRCVIVPKEMEPAIVEELSDQINKMLIKKIYGCLTIQEYQRSISPKAQKKIRSTYQKLNKKGIFKRK